MNCSSTHRMLLEVGSSCSSVLADCSETRLIFQFDLMNFTQGEVLVRSFIVPLDNFSLSATSGWRASNRHVVRSFESKFADQYGQSLFRNVRVHVDSSKEFRKDQAGILLVDGKGTIDALTNLKIKFVDTGFSQHDAGCNDECWQALTNGVPVDGVYFEDFRDDKFSLNLIAECSASHDEDANEYMATTPQQKIRLCLQVKDVQMAWDKTQSWLTSAMGSQKRRQVRRWCEAAKHLSEDILCLMDERATRKVPTTV